ncbi:MAG: DUF1508 domain-containing protein [Spirochaetaceae bacterium]|nr:MAG: DUF1508 domain-containing protein [Spirochaetaceae bacterium]
MAGKFEVYKDPDGKFRFRLKGGNGEIIASGQAYVSKQSCLGGIDAVKTLSPKADTVELE